MATDRLTACETFRENLRQLSVGQASGIRPGATDTVPSGETVISVALPGILVHPSPVQREISPAGVTIHGFPEGSTAIFTRAPPMDSQMPSRNLTIRLSVSIAHTAPVAPTAMSIAFNGTCTQSSFPALVFIQCQTLPSAVSSHGKPLRATATRDGIAPRGVTKGVSASTSVDRIERGSLPTSHTTPDGLTAMSDAPKVPYGSQLPCA